MMEDIIARVPINKTAAIVVSKGFRYAPDKKVLTHDSESPHKTTRVTIAMLGNPAFTDLRGAVFGRFVVVGLAAEFKGRWVVRCVCGRYSTRRKKAILNPQNADDRCEHCRHLAYLQRVRG